MKNGFSIEPCNEPKMSKLAELVKIYRSSASRDRFVADCERLTKTKKDRANCLARSSTWEAAAKIVEQMIAEEIAISEGFVQRNGVWYGYNQDNYDSIDQALANDDCTICRSAEEVCQIQGQDIKYF